MTILVTGGTGFIGSHTVVELLNAGYDVVIADNLCNSKIEVIDRIQKITNKRPAFYQIDLLDSAALEKVFAENRLDAVIHFAGLKSVAESVEDPGRYLDTNLTSTFHLLNAMEKHQVYKLVFSSSATVYGTPETMPNRESDVVGKVCCPYGFSKYLNELLLHDFARQRDNFRFASLRYFNPVGAHPPGLIGEDCGQKAPNNLAPYITRTLLGQFPYLSVYGDQYDTADGTGVRDYIHVVDLAKGHVAAADYAMKHTGTEIINLGTGHGYSVLDIVKAFEKVNGVKVPYRIEERRPGDIAECWADPRKARELLGWTAEKNLEDMCRDAWRWQTQTPNGYAD